MALSLFLDANIILDFILKRDNGEAKAIILLINEGKFDAYTSPVIVHIVAHILKKHFQSGTIKEILLLLLNDVRVVNTTHDVVVNALSSSLTDIEDALQYYTGLHHRVDIMLSRDNDFIKKALPSLPILEPKEFLKLYVKAN